MSTQITTAFVKQYHDTIYMLVQQQGSLLRGTVRNETQKGEFQFFDCVGSTTAVKRTSRHADTEYTSTPHSRRRVTLVDYDWADLIDKPDKVKMLIDPTSTYNTNAQWAMGRAMDDEIIAAALGTAYTGVDGSTSVTFATEGQAYTGASGATLDLADLTSTRRLFRAAEVQDNETLHIIITAKQLEALLNISTLTSADYNSVKALVAGEINTFLGLNFKTSQRLSGATTATCYCLAYAESGMLLSVGEDIEARVDVLPTKKYSTQVFVSMGIGAMRMEGAKVISIVCKDD